MQSIAIVLLLEGRGMRMCTWIRLRVLYVDCARSANPILRIRIAQYLPAACTRAPAGGRTARNMRYIISYFEYSRNLE